jgi:hypothetical protein
MGFEPMIPAFERAKTFRALDARPLRSAHVLLIGIIFFPLTLQKTVPGMHNCAFVMCVARLYCTLHAKERSGEC